MSEKAAYIDLRQQASAQAWWDAILQYCDSFFNTNIVLNQTLAPEQIVKVLIQLETAREAVQQTKYPEHTTNARYHLLNAMSIVTSGFAATLSGDWGYAAQLMDSAQAEIQKFNAELDRLGVT